MTDLVFWKGWIVVASFLMLIQFGALAEQPLSPEEEAAANVVARFVEQSRREKGLPKLRRISDHRLRRDACERAKKDDKTTGQADGFAGEKVGTISAFWYSTEDPTQVPPELVEFATTQKWSEAHRFAVGICLLSASGEHHLRYWVDVGTYMTAFRSLLNVPTWD